MSEACDENKVLDVFILNADLVPPSFSSDVLTGMFGFLETCHAHRFRFFLKNLMTLFKESTLASKLYSL